MHKWIDANVRKIQAARSHHTSHTSDNLLNFMCVLTPNSFKVQHMLGNKSILTKLCLLTLEKYWPHVPPKHGYWNYETEACAVEGRIFGMVRIAGCLWTVGHDTNPEYMNLLPGRLPTRSNSFSFIFHWHLIDFVPHFILGDQDSRLSYLAEDEKAQDQ